MNLRHAYMMKFKCSVEDFVKMFGLIDSDVLVPVMAEERNPIHEKINEIMEEANEYSSK
jgi:hypothetical protein